MAFLEIRNLSRYFGGLAALDQLDLDIFESEILGVIGPNGAGKSTLFNVINGFHGPTSGSVTLKGEEIQGLRPDQIARKGLGRTFQQTALFMESTVFDNVYTGFHKSYRTPLLKQFLHSRQLRREQEATRQKTTEILEFMGLASQRGEMAKNLSHGHQRILGICIALASEPEILLLDEPVTGMNPSETLHTTDLIRHLRDRGITIVIVEHDMKVVMSLCDRVAVLNYGKKIAEGLPREIRENTSVIESYLGKERG